MHARARGSPIEAPVVGFRDTTPPPIKAELRRHCSYYIYKIARLKKRRKRGAKVNIYKNIELAAKALVVNKLIAIFHLKIRKL